MASLTPVYFASALLTGAFLLAVVLYLISAREWYQYTPTAVGAGGGAGDVFASTSRFVRSPVTWTVSFLVFAFVLVLGGLAFVGSPLVAFADRGLMVLVLLAAAVLLFVIYLFAGTYYLAKSRGIDDAAASGLGAGLLGLLVVVAIFLKLLLTG